MHGSSSEETSSAWSLLESAPDAMLVVGQSGHIEFVNAQTEQMFGYARHALLGAPLATLLPERFRAQHVAHLARFFAAPRVRPMGQGLELFGRHARGTEFPVEIALSPVLMAETPHVIAAIRDISARKQIEEELRRSREDLEITLESIGDGVIVSDLAGRVSRINAAAQHLTGWSADAALGRPMEEVFCIFDETTMTPQENPIRQVLREGRTALLTNHTLLRGRSGDERPIADSGAPVRDAAGRLRGAVLVFRDQTAEASARRQLRRSEEMFRGLLDNIPDFVLTLDAAGLIQFANRECPPLGRGDLIGQSWLALATVDCHEAMREALRQVLETGQPATYEVSAVGPDGPLAWWAHHLGPLRHEGRVVGAVVIARDVTEKRRIETQLATSERMASMGMLAAGIAHEINNPLAAIVANLELASDELNALATRSDLPEALLEELSDAALAAARVRAIVRDLRIFSRTESDELTAIDVRQVLESTLRMAWNEIRHRARLTRAFEPVPPVLANEARLGQLFLNLILNAAQAIREGHADANEIRVGTRADVQGNVWVEIRDTGSGISPEVRQRAFEPFFTTKPPGVGTGLGLAICLRIVNGLGGSIEIESCPGAGSLFRVRLPALLRAPGASAAPTAPAPPPGLPRRGRVLVIDDEAMMGSVVRRALEPLHDVSVATRAAEALERLLGGEQFDVILCDIMMPELTGLDFYQALRQRLPAAAERVVFVTGGAFTNEAREFLERSTHPRVDKPFDVAALRAVVNERLR